MREGTEEVLVTVYISKGRIPLGFATVISKPQGNPQGFDKRAGIITRQDFSIISDGGQWQHP